MQLIVRTQHVDATDCSWLLTKELIHVAKRPMSQVVHETRQHDADSILRDARQEKSQSVIRGKSNIKGPLQMKCNTSQKIFHIRMSAHWYFGTSTQRYFVEEM